MSAVLDTLERYYDEVPRSSAEAIAVGPFTLFASRVAWPYYARPRLGLEGPIGPSDVDALLCRQSALGVPHAIEWVAETTPSLLVATRDVGLSVECLPLLVLDALRSFDMPAGVVVRRLVAGGPDVLAAQAVAAVAFGQGGTERGDAGAAERDAALGDAAHRAAALAIDDLLRRCLTAGAVAVHAGDGVVGSGLVNPRADVAEIVAVATLPTARRRGVAALVTADLVDQSRSAGATTVFLSAGSEAVARVYRRVGFVDVGAACVAGGTLP